MTDDVESDGTDDVEPDGADDVESDGGYVGDTAVDSDAFEGTASRPWPRAAFRIAVREYRIAVRSRWAVGLAVLFTVFTVGVVGFGTSAVGPERYAAVIASLVELGVYLIPLAALVVGYDAVVGAEESGALDMLFALPVSHTQIVAGKYLGRFAVLAGAMSIGMSVGGAGAIWIVGPAGIGQYALYVLASVTTAGVFLGVGVFLSTVAREKTQALGAALVTWLWFVLLHDLVAIGLIASVDLPREALAAMALTNPADVFRLLVLSQLNTTTGGFAAVLTKANLSVPIILLAHALWLVVPVVAASRAIRRRP